MTKPRTIRSVWLLLALVAVFACGRKKTAVKAPLGEPVAGLAAIPSGARVVVGVNVSRVATSPLVLRLLTSALDRDPQVREELTLFLSACHLDLARDLESVLVALGDPSVPAEALLVAQGKLDPPAMVACIKSSLAELGQTLTEKQVAGQVAYVTSSQEPIWFTFSAPGTILVAAGEAWLTQARDPGAPKLAQNAQTAALLSRTDTAASAWGVGWLPADVGQALVQVTSQSVKQPATALFGHLRVDKDLSVELNVELHDEADARALSTFAKTQLGQLTLIAQAAGLGFLVSKINLDAHGKTARVSVTLDPADLDKLEAGLADKTHAMDKEGAPK